MKTSSLSEVSKSHPSEELFCIGITGTNGKTTVSYMIEHILKSFFKTGVIGSVDQHLGDKRWESSLTTPSAPELYQRLLEFKKLEAKVVVLEVSSHALVQKRTAHMSFNALVFTHFSSDHLDYHKSVENYFLAKQSLFNSFSKNSFSLESLKESFSSSQGRGSLNQKDFELKEAFQKETPLMRTSFFGSRPLFAVINRDEAYGRRLLISKGIQFLTYGKKEASFSFLASQSFAPFLSSFSFQILKEDFLSSHVEVESPNGEKQTFEFSLLGEHNVYNALAAIAVTWKMGVPFSQCLELVSTFPGVPGRLERVDNDKGVKVFVDYAHTESALSSVLESFVFLKKRKKSPRIFTVFGCGGNRDREKRPLMARVAFEKSNQVFFTSDNPRTEALSQIIEDALKGLAYVSLRKREEKWHIEMDRKKAIFSALRLAKKGDFVLVLGKGHERYQITEKGKQPFDDREKIREFFSLS